MRPNTSNRTAQISKVDDDVPVEASDGDVVGVALDANAAVVVGDPLVDGVVLVELADVVVVGA